MQTLTNGQKQALLEAQNGHNIFISGGGGVGKSYISINEQIQNIAQKKDTLCRRMYN